MPGTSTSCKNVFLLYLEINNVNSIMLVQKQVLNHWQKIRTMNHGTVNEQNPRHQIPIVKVLTSNWLGCQNGDEHKESLNRQPSLQVHWIFIDIYHIATHKNWFKTITQFFLQPPSSYNRVIILLKPRYLINLNYNYFKGK